MKGNSKPNLVLFVALMGTSALALSSKAIFDNTVSNVFAYSLELTIIFIFLIYFSKLISHMVKRKDFFEEINDPVKSSFYSSSSIAAALISLMLIKIGLPYLQELVNVALSGLFWIISLELALLFIIIVPVSLKFRSKVEHVTGVWFLPSVGLFVLISAGSALALHTPTFQEAITMINLFLFGPAFIIYFLTLTLLYFRSKFYPPVEGKVVPTFQISLAPIGVSILAIITTSQLLLSNDLFGFASLFANLGKIYGISFFGYGLWILVAHTFLYRRIIKEHTPIPFSELWWAFVFPIGAFTLATVSLYNFVLNYTFVKAIYFTLYSVLLGLWIYVLSKQVLIKHQLRKSK